MTDAELRQLFEAWYLELGQTDACSPVPLLWIGAQEPSWVWQEDAAGRFMLSGARAMERHGDRPWPRATVPVMWDSGAYIHLKKHGRWTWPAHDYAAYTARACRGLGRIEHAAPQDWMCETDILLKTHAHELRTDSKAEADAWLLARRTAADAVPDRRLTISAASYNVGCMCVATFEFGLVSCGSSVAVPELAPVVTRTGTRTAPWRTIAAGLPPSECYAYARTKRDALARLATPDGMAAWIRHAAACAERIGLFRPAPVETSACNCNDIEPLDKRGSDPLGEWPGCVSTVERNGFGPPAVGGPTWEQRIAVQREWTCTAC